MPITTPRLTSAHALDAITAQLHTAYDALRLIERRHVSVNEVSYARAMAQLLAHRLQQLEHQLDADEVVRNDHIEREGLSFPSRRAPRWRAGHIGKSFPLTFPTP